MRPSAITVCVAVLLAATPALARDRSKHHKEAPKQVEEQKPAEPAADADSGWDQSAESIAKKKPAQDTASDTDQPTAADDNVAAIDAASESTSKDEEVATKEPPTWWFGAYLHGVWVPSFMLGLFLEGPPTIGNPAFGVTATHRSKEGFSLVLGLGYAGYGFEGPMHEKGKPDVDTEWVKSTLGLVHVTGALLWSSEIVADKLSFEYGIGLDFGIITGSMTRTEAYPNGRGGYAPCVGPLNPNAQYCELPQNVAAGTDAYDQQGAQYHVLEKRIPPVIVLPMLPLLTLRYTPVRNLAVKLEGAYGIFQFMFGLSAAYGVDI